MSPILRMLVTVVICGGARIIPRSYGGQQLCGDTWIRFGLGLTANGGVEPRSVVDDRVDLFDQSRRNWNRLWPVDERAHRVTL